MARISKRIVDAAAPTDKDYFIWDDSLPAFAVRVWPSGRKVYVVHYRANGRLRRYTLGTHGSSMTAEKARAEAIKVLAKVKDGEDPANERVENRKALTMKQFGKLFLDKHVDVHLKPTTRAEYRRSVELFITPKFGARKVIDITRADIAEFHHEMRDTPYQANRTLGVISKMFSLADLWEVRKDGVNPCRGVKRYKEDKKERFLTADEYKRLGKVLDSYSGEPEAVYAIRLLMLTGCRLSEIQTLKWSYVSMKQSELHLPDSKTGAKVIQLGQAAVDMLKTIPKLKDNPYVITGKVEGQHLTDLQRPWRRIRKLAGLEDVRIHDLRHSFASDALEMGEDLTMIGKMLGHTDIKTTARYAHLKKSPVKNATDNVAARIAASLAASEDLEPAA